MEKQALKQDMMEDVYSKIQETRLKKVEIPYETPPHLIQSKKKMSI
jgi:hypothetical protein